MSHLTVYVWDELANAGAAAAHIVAGTLYPMGRTLCGLTYVRSWRVSGERPEPHDRRLCERCRRTAGPALEGGEK